MPSKPLSSSANQATSLSLSLFLGHTFKEHRTHCRICNHALGIPQLLLLLLTRTKPKMKKSGLLAASVAAATAVSVSSSTHNNSHHHHQDGTAEIGRQSSSPATSSSSEKFAPRFDGLRFIETLVTAHR